MAYVLSLLMLVMLTTMAVSMASTTEMAMLKSSNACLELDARLAADSGTNFISYLIITASLGGSSDAQQMLDVLAASLGENLDGSATLQGASVTYDGTTITVPSIWLTDCQRFDAHVAIASGNVLRLSVSGQAPTTSGDLGQAVTRSVSMDFKAQTPGALGYGVFSKGSLVAGTNLNYVGAGSPSDASFYTAASGTAVTLGSGYVDGSVNCLYADAQVVSGATVNGGIHLGMPEVPAPVPDGSVFEPFATRIVDSHTDFSGGPFDNIRIKAGTNPEFGNNVAVRGVMYVEAPNNVSFGNNISFTGVMVTQDPGAGADPALHTIYFKNNMAMRGVEDLPDTSDFHVLRGMGGTAILAPGFTVQFKNNFLTCTTQGTILADRLIAGENLTASVCGSIITLNGGMQLNNNARITITLDQSRYGGSAPGVTTGGPVTLARMPDTYCEGS